MFDLDVWLADYVRVMRSAFGARVRFIGIQGSRARGEASEGSDIDVVLILDRLDFDDLRRYREAAESLPQRELLCGFVSGVSELRGWDKGELFGFYFDTRPVLGRLEDIIPLPRSGDAERAAHTGACGIYHACSHNYLHERSVEVLSSLLKTSRFVLRARCFCETGRYFSSLAELADQLSGTDRAVLALSMDPGTAAGDFEGCSRLLLDWARELIGSGEQ